MSEEIDTLRRDAEERAEWLRSQQGVKETTEPSVSPLRRRFTSKEKDREVYSDDEEAFHANEWRESEEDVVNVSSESRYGSIASKNMHTADVARLAAQEFRVNGGRARADIRHFVGPRWELDEEAPQCRGCNSTFDCLNRRHHCRYCGKIFCGDCSSHKMLLPHEFNQPDPQRVCVQCQEVLQPAQGSLSQSMANHKRTNYLDLGPGACRRYMNMPFALTLGSEIRKAAYSVINLFSLEVIKDKRIPLELLKRAQGLLFVTVAKAGFIFGARGGTGLVISRLPDDSWSAPSAVGVVGVTWGLQVGVDVTDYVVILNSEDALMPFTSEGQITLGAEVNIAAGPLGRSVSADACISKYGLAPAYSYSHSRGLFAGAALEGSLVFPRNNVNHRFYGMPYSPADLLSGRVDRPKAAEPLYNAIDKALGHYY